MAETPLDAGPTVGDVAATPESGVTEADPGLPGSAGPSVVAHDELGASVPTVDVERWRRLALDALVTEGVRRGELTLTFVDEVVMAELNETHMDESGPTDVLSFPLDAEDGLVAGDTADGPPVLLGDVVVCPAVAERQATARGGDPDDELALLVVHGVLHVLGHDHAEPDETARMRAREHELLERHHR